MTTYQGIDMTQSKSKEQVCYICKEGVLQRGIYLLFETDSFYECSRCHSEFHKQSGKFLLKHIPNNSLWKKYEEKVLSLEEIKRIAQGGLSDAEIARQKLEEDERIRKDKEEEEDHRRKEQTPGTPENYLLRFRMVLGIQEGDNAFELAVQAKNDDEIKQYLKHIGQLQKELAHLKKEITATKKHIKSNYDEKKSEVNAETAVYGSSRAMVSLRTRQKQLLDRQRDLTLQAYDVVTRQIDSAILSLDKGKIEIENQWMGLKINSPKEKKKNNKSDDADKNIGEFTLEDALKEINQLIGLDNVKTEIQQLVDFLKIQQLRKSRSLPTPNLSLHVVFYGNPGTGKTTVARLLSKIFKALGILSKGHLVEVDRSGLVAGYVGQTAIKVNEVAEKAIGGVLFIDEAYSLTDNDEGGFGSEAIDALIKVMEDHRNDLAVVIAGYTGKMDNFLSSNPGLKSRFNRYWEFRDYTPPELFKIFLFLCKSGQFEISNNAIRKLAVLLQRAYDERDNSFGNGRFVRNLYEETISNQASRLVSKTDISTEALRMIESEDIPNNLGVKRIA